VRVFAHDAHIIIPNWGAAAEPGGGGKETRNGAGVTPVNTEKIKKVRLPYTLFQKSQKIKKRFIYEILGTKSIDI
jgi:hypothetical protein